MSADKIVFKTDGVDRSDIVKDKVQYSAVPSVKLEIRSVGKKHDDGKAPVVQGCLNYFPKALAAVALVSKYGADKYNVAYSDQNWRRVDGAIGRYSDALLRHLGAVNFDGDYDPESAHLHLAHVAWNALAILEMTCNTLPALNPDPDLDKLAQHMRERYESQKG